MLNVRVFAAVGVLVSLVGLPASSAQPELDTKAAKLFKVRWSSITYTKTISNPDASTMARQSPAGSQTQTSLSIFAQIELLDPNRVLGTSREAVITQLVDGAGREVNVPPAPSVTHQFYEAPRRMRRYSQPPQEPKWQAMMRSVLRLPSPTVNFRPQLIDEWQPNSMNLKLDVDLLKQSASEIRRIKGHFSAVIPDGTESIDVPFDPNSNWVQLTPDLEIQVQEAACTGSSYRYNIQTRGQGRMPTLSSNFSGTLLSRMVTAQQLIGMDGKPMNPSSTGGGSSSTGRTGSMTGSGSGLAGPIKALRFIIAVNPTPREIPFEIEHVPLPKP